MIRHKTMKNYIFQSLFHLMQLMNGTWKQHWAATKLKLHASKLLRFQLREGKYLDIEISRKAIKERGWSMVSWEVNLKGRSV